LRDDHESNIRRSVVGSATGRRPGAGPGELQLAEHRLVGLQYRPGYGEFGGIERTDRLLQRSELERRRQQLDDFFGQLGFELGRRLQWGLGLRREHRHRVELRVVGQ
jgi:hypothetical protein